MRMQRIVCLHEKCTCRWKTKIHFRVFFLFIFFWKNLVYYKCAIVWMQPHRFRIGGYDWGKEGDKNAKHFWRSENCNATGNNLIERMHFSDDALALWPWHVGHAPIFIYRNINIKLKLQKLGRKKKKTWSEKWDSFIEIFDSYWVKFGECEKNLMKRGVEIWGIRNSPKCRIFLPFRPIRWTFKIEI